MVAINPGSPLTGRVHAKSHPFKKMKREIAAVVVLCAACVEGASRLDGHKGKHTLTLSVLDRTPEKKKGNLTPPCCEDLTNRPKSELF
jgi:hypothetical protein